MIGGLEHLVVVGHDVAKVYAELLRCGEMDGVERSKMRWQQRARGVEHAVVHSHEFNSCEHGSASDKSFVTLEEEGAQDLRASQRTRYEGRSPSQMPTQRTGLGLSNRELHECGGNLRRI